MSRRSPRLTAGLRIFLTGWLVYSLHFATDVVREHYPAFSLAERATLRVDPYIGLHPDLFEIPGRGAFINNNPGASLFGALPYALARPAIDVAVERVTDARGDRPAPEFADERPNRRAFFARTYAQGLDVRFGLATGVIQAFGLAPLSAAMLVVMHGLLRRFGFGARSSTWLTLTYGFATPLFFRSAFLNHNLLVAHATLASFALLYCRDGIALAPRRLFAAGLASGAGLLCDYAGAVPLVALGLYALAGLHRAMPARQAMTHVSWMIAGAALPVAGLLAYQAWAFGHPLFPAQHYMPATQYSTVGWNGFAWPSIDLMGANLFDLRFGLLAFGPLLALAFVQPLVTRAGGARVGGSERLLAFGLFAALLLFTSANQYARLQWNTGFRMLAAALPLLFLLCADVLTRLPKRIALSLTAVAAFHAWCLAMVRSDAVESVWAVATSGPRLPWLTSLWRAGDAYLPVSASPALLSLPLLALTAALLAWLWTRGWPEAEAPRPDS